MSDTLSKVEDALFNRMLKNAFQGFVKSAVVAGVIGAAIGAALFGCGFLSPQLLSTGIVETCLGSQTLAGAVVGALTFLLPAGAFGATAGINSARDARRFILRHEVDRLPPVPDGIDPLQSVLPAMNNIRESEHSTTHADRCRRPDAEPSVLSRIH